MKKRLIFLTLIFMAILISCEHNHTYEEKWSYDEDYHYLLRTCSCGDEQDNRLIDNKEKHNYIETIITYPTHFEKGVKEYKCSVCDYSYTASMDIISHSYKWEYDETIHYEICDCQSKVDLSEHEFETIEKEYVCGDKKVTIYNCVVCGYSIEVSEEETSHDMDQGVVTKEPTCEEEGIKRYSCTRCDYYEEEVLEEKHHSFDITEEIVKVSCVESGLIRHKCSKCDKYYDEEIKEFGHSLDNGVVTNAPSCTESGLVRYNCSRCDYYLDEVENKLGHDMNEGVVVKNATHLDDGIFRQTCKRCEFFQDEIIPAEGFEEDVMKNRLFLITTTPGDDATKSIGISWHAINAGTYLVLRKENAKEFEIFNPVEENWCLEEKYEEDAYNNKRMVCNVSLTDLEANTTYQYQIIDGEISSPKRSFKTASGLEDYRFMSTVDFQYSMNTSSLNLIKKFKSEVSGINLLTCSGDFADEGSRERSHRHLFDNEVFDNLVVAFGAGDHEYWGSGDKIDGHYPQFSRPYSYNRLFNNPKNGPSDYLNSCYYFGYNTTLFIFLDCADSNTSSGSIFDVESKWLDEVLTKEKSKYSFIVVCMHKSLYGAKEQDSGVSKIGQKFIPVFDKHSVDLVISGHDHEYSRTYSLKNDVINKTGTVYLDLGNSGNKTRALDKSLLNSTKHEKTIDIKSTLQTLGILASVRGDKMYIDVLNLNFENIDSVTITKKNR